eukprot:6349206-Lingulodinium_polyedra.AAC.1
MKRESYPEDARFFVAEADFRVRAADCVARSAVFDRVACAERMQRQQDLLSMALDEAEPMRAEGS